jgi:hypothetical protein
VCRIHGNIATTGSGAGQFSQSCTVGVDVWSLLLSLGTSFFIEAVDHSNNFSKKEYGGIKINMAAQQGAR